MKTLDEVIKAMETDPVPMAYTARLSVHEDIMTDALHYLREWRDFQLGIIKVGNEMEDAIEKEFPDNPALSWSELKQMEGKPVWVEFFYEDGQHFDSTWFLVGFVSESFCDVIGRLGTSRLVKNDYWQAYRKERTE